MQEHIGEKAFSNNLIIEHIQLPDSILRINDFAFFGCRNLRKVKFGLGIRKIGDNAFAECESLQDIQIRSEMDCIRNCYNSFLDEYFSDNNQRTILNKLLEGLKLTFINS